MAEQENGQTVRKIRPNRLKFFLRSYLAGALFAAVLFAMGFFAAGSGMAASAEMALALWVAGAIIILIALAHTVLHCNTTCIYIANEEVVYEAGIIEKHKIRAPLHMISDTKLYRDYFGTIIGEALIQINTSGAPGYEIEGRFGAKDMEKFQNELYSLIRKTPTSLPDRLAKK